MNGPIGATALVVLGYLIGSVPVGLLVGRLLGGVDLREHGSRRTGTTNALRTLGLPAAIGVFVLDVAKGVVAVLLVRWLYRAGAPGSPDWVAAAAGLAAVIGHIRSIFMRFGGGRGVATSAGGLGALAPLGLAIVVPIVALLVWRTRFVSAGSLAAAILAPVIVAILAALSLAAWAAVAYCVGAGLLIVWAHGDNIARLRAGTERRIGQPAEPGGG